MRMGSFLVRALVCSTLIISGCSVKLLGGDALDFTSSADAIVMSPTTGSIGSLLTLTGVDFSQLQSVAIGGVPTIVVNHSASSAQVMVMPGTSTHALTYVTAGISKTTSGSFTVASAAPIAHQQGAKLTPSDGIIPAQSSVSLSADGNTAAVGGWNDNSDIGATWIYTRTGGTWTQQGLKLIGTGAVGAAYQGYSTALSADGNTLVTSGSSDNGGIGAIWIFTRTNDVWTQQGAKLVASDAIGAAYQGNAVRISADGNTVLVGGAYDNTDKGAMWVFTRTAGVWSQQGLKLLGTGAVGGANQGYSVALSADGNTAISGGWGDNAAVGAAWVFTRTGTTWTQQGAKLVSSDYVGVANIGASVALNADGNTALIGAEQDGASGAAWIYTRSAGVWTQQGTKIVGTGAVGNALQGWAGSLSADGNLAMVGGQWDNGKVGAFWLFTRSGAVWSQQGAKFAGTGAIGQSYQASVVALSADGTTAFSGGAQDNGTKGAAWAFGP
jgi:hypothetical protein